MIKSWKPEVIADSSGEWCGNALLFATREEAERYVFDLAMRWTLVRDTRVIDVEGEPNYRMLETGRATPIEDKS
jgi:hypothetical protein